MKVKTLPKDSKVTAITVEAYVTSTRVTLSFETETGYIDLYLTPDMARAMMEELRLESL